MAKEMLINVSEGEECRIALLEDGKLEELYMERTSSTSHVGNVYKGRVTNVEPSIQAAFVDFGLGRNGFLHISDLLPQYFGRKGEDVTEAVGRKMARRDRPPIQRCLRRGDEIIVQIIKEGIGTKGPTLSTYLSIPGRILVMMPGMASKGVSRKIEDEEERRRLRKILDELKPPKDCGFIIRTAGVGKSKADIERDLKYLTRLWDTIKKKRDTVAAPVELYTEGDLVTRSVRDVFTADVDRIVVDNKEVARKIKEFIKLSAPRGKNKVDLYEEAVPLFHKYGIEHEIEQMYSRHVPLPSGGSLVIDSTEAIVAIDVNSGKFRDHSDAETTAFKTDMEAADEIARQLKLRDLGGVIICDFIDLRYERHRRALEEKLHNNLKNDRAKTKVLRMSQFGIIEMTRQRMRPSLKRSVYFDCPHCKGSGLVKTPESMSLDVMRRLAIALHDQRVARVEMSVSTDVAFYMLNRNRMGLARLEDEAGKSVTIKADDNLALDEHKMQLFDARDGMVYIQELGILPELPGGGRGGHQHGGRHQQNGRRDERRHQQQQGRGGQQQQQSHRRDSRDDEDNEADHRHGLDSVEDAVDQRDEEHATDAEREPDTVEAQDDRRGGGNDRRDARRGGDDRGRRDDRGGRHDDRRDQHQRGGGRDQRHPQQQQGRRDQQPQQQQRHDRQHQQPQRHTPAAGGATEPAVAGGGDLRQNNGGPGGQPFDPQQGEGGGGRRRRRRRRGGRGRGGRGNDQQQYGSQQQGGGDQGQPQFAGAGRDEAFDFDEDAGGSAEGRDEVDTLEGVTEPARGGDADFDVVESREDRDDRERADRFDEEPVSRSSRGEMDDSDEIAPAPEPIEDTPSMREPEPVAEEPAVAEPVVEEKPEPSGEEKPKRRRGTRAASASKSAGKKTPTTRRSRSKKATAAAATVAAAEAEQPAAEFLAPDSPAAPVRIPPPPITEEKPAVVTRTGSTDRHQLHGDEPVNPEPVRRPRSYRDLDEIPDDFD